MPSDLLAILKQSVRLMQEGCIGGALRYFLYSLIGQRRALRVQVGGVPLTVRTCSTDVVVALSSLKHDEFEASSAECKRLVSGFIVDAGGYIGTAAIAMARRFPDATIVTLEPNANNYEILTLNVAPFENIVPLKKALFSRATSLNLRDRGSGDWGFQTTEPAAETGGEPPIEHVEGVSLDALLDVFDKPGVDLLKLDIEGSEKAVFDHSAGWIERVGVLVVELHDRIIAGCARSYYAATTGMRDACSEDEKVIAVNDSYFE